MEDLTLAEGLRLPLEAVVETFAVLGRRGRGKTTTAVVLAEEMIGAGLPVLVIDPLGVWWGLRSSADGKQDGLPVVIFGGDHADIPLTEKAGELIADAVVDGRFPAILDLSHLSKSAMRRFMADFVDRLYHRNRHPLHVIVDEADLFAPQRTAPEGARLLGAMEDLQRRGRARGIGTTLITQRPAVLHKDLLSQAEVLIALGLTSPRDVAAIDEWVRLHADEDEARTVKSSLAGLGVGEAWVWSPAWLDILQRVQIRDRMTFDSSATPKPGAPRPAATAFASVDTKALGARIEELAAEAVAADPKHLRTEVARLRRELDQAQETPHATTPAKVERVEVPVLTDAQLAVLDEASNLVREHAANACHRAEAAVKEIGEQVARMTSLLNEVRAAARTPAPTKPSVMRAEQPRRKPATPVPSGGETTRLGKAPRLILTALAQHGIRTAKQVALLTAYSHKSGGYRNALSELRTSGFIEGSGTTGMSITAEGLEALGDIEPLPTGEALLDWWKDNHLGKAERAIVEVLAEDYPSPVPVTDIAERAGYSAASGGYRNALSRLRSLGIAYNDSPGILVLSPEFFD